MGPCRIGRRIRVSVTEPARDSGDRRVRYARSEYDRPGIEVRAVESHNCFVMSKMNVRRGIAAVLLSLSLQVARASHWSPGQAPRPASLHIRLVDLAGIPEKLRAAGEGMVQEIYRQAGLELDFVDCPEAGPARCGIPPGPSEFWLQILNRPPNHLQRDSTGFAVLVPTPQPGDSYAAVSLPMVESAARHLEVPAAEVLAASMAHEIGHLLLHSSWHSHAGVMSPRMDRKQIQQLERGELLFSTVEAARLAECARRLAP